MSDRRRAGGRAAAGWESWWSCSPPRRRPRSFAPAVDFFSIGTNDLTGQVLGLDRRDPAAKPALAAHPRVLALISRVVEAGRQAGIGVSVCGDSAADPLVLPLLVGLGVDTLSVPAARVQRVRSWLAELATPACAELAAAALAALDRGRGMEAGGGAMTSAERGQLPMPPRPAPRSRDTKRADSTTARASSSLIDRRQQPLGWPDYADRPGHADPPGSLSAPPRQRRPPWPPGPRPRNPACGPGPARGPARPSSSWSGRSAGSGHRPWRARPSWRPGWRRSRARARRHATEWPRPPRGSAPCCRGGTRGAARSPASRTGSRPRPPRSRAGRGPRPSAANGRAARSRPGRRCRAGARRGRGCTCRCPGPGRRDRASQRAQQPVDGRLGQPDPVGDLGHAQARRTGAERTENRGRPLHRLDHGVLSVMSNTIQDRS